ncbi:expressed unknown protein [Seminavis robusta]|uniref:Uncharacterized protein n=1 Tax=Seminavis robusta TaxID=568900 RepID=A0A9N8HGZ9_9STRA|nr:expressed unknown protein [Seminavis robusta]|eukprot:Sro671_g184850.1 n/a (336) ;mRNA; f:18822-19829
MEFTRWDYIGRDHAFCKECGCYFIQSSQVDFCSSCRAEIAWEPTDCAFRALRTDELVLEEGFQPANPNANVSVEQHVLDGSVMDTQFISFTWSLDVAVFFAVKGFLARGNMPRVAVASVPLDRFQDLSDMGILVDWTARNYARVFREFLVTDETKHLVDVEKVLELDPAVCRVFWGHTGSFRDFQSIYETSVLRNKVIKALRTTKLAVEVDLVGLPHYRALRENVNLHFIRLVLENDNPHDQNNAIRVDGCNVLRQEKWHTIGYLSSEHAEEVRMNLALSGNRYRCPRFPDLNPTYETWLEIHFEVHNDCAKAKLRLHGMRDSAGKAWFEPVHII